jgi:hypothetical protein
MTFIKIRDECLVTILSLYYYTNMGDVWMNVCVFCYICWNGLWHYLNKNILSNGHFVYQEARPGSDLWPSEDTLWEGQVGGFHLQLIIIKSSKYLYVMLLSDFNRLKLLMKHNK